MKKLFAIAATCVFLGSTATGLAADTATGQAASEKAPGLGAGDPAAGQQKSAACVACHGADGNSVNGEWPKLAGQHPLYTVKQLQNYKLGAQKEGGRVNAIMNGLAAPLNEQDMQDLAAYFAAQPPAPSAADPALVEQGKAIYQGGNPLNSLSACIGCHGPTGLGNPAAGFPRLAGQHAQYTEIQLKAFRAMQRANDPGQMMRNIAAQMTDNEIRAVASYIQGLR